MFDQIEGERGPAAAEAAARLAQTGARFGQMEFSDINGVFRGKLTTLDKALAPGGTGISTLVMSARSGDVVVLTEWSDFANGFPKMVAVADPDTAVEWPWKPNTAGVLCDLYMEDGSECILDGRHMLRRIAAEYASEGLEPRAAIEWEFYLYEVDDALMRAKRFRELQPFGRGLDYYSVTRDPSFVPLATEFLDRAHSIGIDVEVFHTEYGHGMYEYTCGHAPLLKSADDAIRSKAYLRQLCADHGVVPTFMAALHQGTDDSHNGCHHNVSVWRDGQNMFWNEESGGVSQLGHWFAGGVLATMPDFHLVMRPWVNSYRRFDRLDWNPVDASWGLDNHAVALRVVHGAVPRKHARFEHRVPSPDVNPYLSLAAVFWGGLYGIRNRIEPPEMCAGDPVGAGRYAALPATLPDSIRAFSESPLARECFGDKFVDQYSRLKDDEWNAYTHWCEEEGIDPAGPAITDWEFQQYFNWC
ncbi:glutamine synthetase family protein [Mycobacterium sp. NPDC051198]